MLVVLGRPMFAQRLLCAPFLVSPFCRNMGCSIALWQTIWFHSVPCGTAARDELKHIILVDAHMGASELDSNKVGCGLAVLKKQ